METSRPIFSWLFTIAVLVAVVLPNLLQDGMFMDGMLYATVSKNMAHGIGSFWFPHYSSTLYPFFDQQPPLGFGIQSVFFTCFGDSIYVERFYSFLCAIANAYLIAVLWRVFFKHRQQVKKIAWFPVLLWITIPVCFWSFSNNVLENTMSVFDLLSLICIAKYLVHKQRLKYLIGAGICVFLATFTKGIQGAFPLAAVFLGWVVYRNISFAKMVSASAVLWAIPLGIYFILIQNNDAYTSLATYLGHRVLNSIKNVSEVESRFYLAGRLFMELIPALVLTGIIFLLGRKQLNRAQQVLSEDKKHILFLILVGISASFPLMVTLEQRGFYLTTSLPYFAMAMAMFSAVSIAHFIHNINQYPAALKTGRIFAVLALAGSLTFSFMQVGKTSRDSEMLHDVYLIGAAVPGGTVLGSTRELWKNYSLQEYLVRHFYICQADTILPEHNYLLLTGMPALPGIRATKVDIPTLKYHLYKVAE